LGFIGIADAQTVLAEGMNIPPIAPQAIPTGERSFETLAI
jgi:FMN-dependent NADH-azoreductase